MKNIMLCLLFLFVGIAISIPAVDIDEDVGKAKSVSIEPGDYFSTDLINVMTLDYFSYEGNFPSDQIESVINAYSKQYTNNDHGIALEKTYGKRARDGLLCISIMNHYHTEKQHNNS